MNTHEKQAAATGFAPVTAGAKYPKPPMLAQPFEVP